MITRDEEIQGWLEEGFNRETAEALADGKARYVVRFDTVLWWSESMERWVSIPGYDPRARYYRPLDNDLGRR